MLKPPGQERQSLNPREYKHAIVVYGSRYYKDKMAFHTALMEFIKRFGNEPIIFLSGAASSGADRMIIQWCKKFGYPCKLYPADWERYEKAAGPIRNRVMAEDSTEGLGFWNGVSKGTKNMTDTLIELERPVMVMLHKAD
jgi:YspA, cpYpsA-related SLOG family